MDLGLRDKVVLITGGSKGIGLACARGFIEEAARVGITSRSPANLDKAREGLGRDIVNSCVWRFDQAAIF